MFGKSGVHDLGGGAGNVVAALYFIPWRVVICACESKQGNIRTLTTDYTLFTNMVRERMMDTYVYINLVHVRVSNFSLFGCCYYVSYELTVQNSTDCFIGSKRPQLISFISLFIIETILERRSPLCNCDSYVPLSSDE